eukprot:4652301-Alexandrium_andersonii.AAC.1
MGMVWHACGLGRNRSEHKVLTRATASMRTCIISTYFEVWLLLAGWRVLHSARVLRLLRAGVLRGAGAARR